MDFNFFSTWFKKNETCNNLLTLLFHRKEINMGVKWKLIAQ